MRGASARAAVCAVISSTLATKLSSPSDASQVGSYFFAPSHPVPVWRGRGGGGGGGGSFTSFSIFFVKM